MGTKIVYKFHFKKSDLLIALCFIERQTKKQKGCCVSSLRRRNGIRKAVLFLKIKTRRKNIDPYVTKIRFQKHLNLGSH